MGWLWSSSPPAGDESLSGETSNDGRPTKPRDFGLSERQRSRIFGTPEAPQSTDRSTEAPPDKELDTFLKTFSDSDAAEKKAIKSEAERTHHERIRSDGTLDISPSTLYPRTMSCRQAFDHAFYCQSLGGKFNDIYRFGHLQSCSEQWGAFWMCMRTRTLSTRVRQESIREYYETRDVNKRKEFGSSEDVWEIRTVAVTQAFGKEPDFDGGEGAPQVNE